MAQHGPGPGEGAGPPLHRFLDALTFESIAKKGYRGRRVLFDILKRWASNVYHRNVDDAKPQGCPWNSLIASFLEVGLQVTESEMRRALIHCYMNLDHNGRLEAAERKLADHLSFFRLAKYRNVDEVLKHWNWYLYCLTFESKEFTSDQIHWNRLPEETVVRMPVDFVDLEVISQSFEARLTAIPLQSCPVSFGLLESTRPQAMIVVHDGLWAPMLSSKTTYQDFLLYTNQVVELADSLPDYLQNFVRETGCTMLYEPLKECYTVCVGQHILPVPRKHIKGMITEGPEIINNGNFHYTRGQRSDYGGPQKDYRQGPAMGLAPLLEGIPDGEVEFQMLFELVVQDLLSRVEEIRDSLSGRPHVKRHPMKEYEKFFHGLKHINDIPEEELQFEAFEPPTKREKPTPNGDGHSNGSSNGSQRRGQMMALHEVKDLLEDSIVWVKCQQSFDPGKDRAFLECRSGEFICLVKAGSEFPDGSMNFLAHRLTSPEQKWVFSDVICQFVAREAFAPQKDWPHPKEEFLSVQPGDFLQLIERMEDTWKEWAVAIMVSSQKEGLVPLKAMEGQVFVQQTRQLRPKSGSPQKDRSISEPRKKKTPGKEPVWSSLGGFSMNLFNISWKAIWNAWSVILVNFHPREAF